MRTVRLSSLAEGTLELSADTLVVDDRADGEYGISVAAGAKLVYACAQAESGDARRTIRLAGEGATATVRGTSSAEGLRIRRRLEVRLEAPDTSADIALLSLAAEGGEIDLDASLVIPAGVKRAKWSLREDNVFLGSSGKIRGLPTLLVHSDDVEASHAMRVERIPDERIFYLRSRGLSRQESLDALVGAMVRANLAPAFEAGPDAHAELLRVLRLPDTD